MLRAAAQPGDGREDWLKEQAKAAGFNVEVIGMGGGDITARVIAEAANPTINVVWGPQKTSSAR